MEFIDSVVVGAGIIGCTVAKALRRQGRDVLLLDSGKENAGTKPSGGHLKPSWFGGMSKAQYEPAMELLDDCWGLISEDFKVWPTAVHTTVYRVDTDVVVKYPRTQAEVVALDLLDTLCPKVIYTIDGNFYNVRCRLLVVAAGVWCADLLPEVFSTIKITPKQGVSFRLRGRLQEPFIKPWAPYKQVVAHQQSDNQIWVGDGSAILPENWKPERTKECLARCQKATNIQSAPVSTLVGYRPYCQTGNDPCLLKQTHKRVWVATGAGKLGTIAAGWAAWRIINATSG